MQIKILGSGCANCKTLFRRTEDALKDLNIQAEVIKVEDIQAIMSYGIMSTPGLVIDEKVVSQGRVPSVEALKGVITRSSWSGKSVMDKRIPILPFALLPLWVILYMALQPGVDYLVDKLLSLSQGVSADRGSPFLPV